MDRNDAVHRIRDMFQTPDHRTYIVREQYLSAPTRAWLLAIAPPMIAPAATTAENGGAISIVAAAIPPVSAVVAVSGHVSSRRPDGATPS